MRRRTDACGVSPQDAFPGVVSGAADLGITGHESRETLDADTVLKARMEGIRLAAGPLNNLGDVAEKSVPKMMLVAPPAGAGHFAGRRFWPLYTSPGPRE